MKDGVKHVITFAFCLVFVSTRYFEPGFFDNEWSYSINPVKILHPDYLKFDFFFDRVYPYFLVYDGLVSPLYKFLSFLSATLVCRVTIWAFQIWTLTRLCRTLGLAWWGIVFIFVAWLNTGQTLVAGEWIIGSASAKPVAYGFVFLAMDSLIRGRHVMAGIGVGLAISFHVLVGGWFLIAMISAIALRQEMPRFKGIVTFSSVALVFSLPGLLPALKDNLHTLMPIGSVAGTPGMGGEIARLSVLMATPFHLDPGYFLFGLKYVKLIFFFGLSIFFAARFLPEKSSRFVVIILGCVVVVFLSGLVAWRLEWYRYLQYYPFRVADGVVPLFFWIGVVAALQRITQEKAVQPRYLLLSLPLVIGVVNMGLLPFRVKSADDINPQTISSILLSTEPRNTAYWIRERIVGWTRFNARKDVDGFREMECWIRDHTPRDSIFITPPWKHSFALNAQRAQFVTPLKYIPSNYKILEWKKRMEILNRGPLRSVGRELWEELPRNYSQMTEDEARAIKEWYGAEYLLAPVSMKLSLQIVWGNASWILYGI